MAITKYSALRNVLKDEEEEQKKKSSALTTPPQKTTTTASAQTTSSLPTLKSLLKKSESSTTAKTSNETPKKTGSTSKTLSFSEALKATPSTVKTTGEQLDKVRENVQKKAKTTTATSGSRTVDISAWKKALSDEDTVSRVKASREIAASALANRNTPAKQKETKDALALRNQEARVAALRKEEEAKKKAYEKLPVLDKVFNISADAYAADESRLRKAAEVEYDRMRMTPEEFEEQHKADLGESLYQIAHSGATGVAGSFARAADVGTAIVSGAKEALDGGSFVKGYQEAIASDDSLYNQVYEQYEREYEENRRIDGEVNTLTKYASQAAQSVGEQAVMLWTASVSSALYGGSKIAGAIASKADDLISSGKKGLKLVGKTLGKVDAGKLGGAASMLITSSASATEQAINDMRAINEKRHSLGRVAAYTDETIARNAALYGVLNGLSETVLEYAIGGVTGAAGSALPSPKVKNPILTAALSYLKGAAGEGFEEMVQTLSSTGLEKLTYNENASVDWQEVIDSGIVGALSGAAMGAPAAVQNTKFGVSAMRDVSSAVKAAKKAETDAAGAFVAVSSTAKAQAYSEIAEDIRKTGSENAETLASIYDWAAEQHLKVAETLTGDSSRAEVQEKAKKENKKQAKREAEQTASAAERDAKAAASVNPTAEEVPNADVNAIEREANTFERDVNAPIQTAETPVTASVEAPNAITSPEAVSSTQTPAQEETTSVQNKIRAEALQRENVSAKSDDATVVTDFALQLQRGASKNTNLKTVQKLADAVRIVQSGQMPDKTYNEALNLLKNASVRSMVETELGSDTVIDPKHIRISLETVSKRYAETAERADMDSLSEEITSVAERSAEDKVTIADGQMTRAEFVRSFGAELARRGLAADDVFDNLLAHELKAAAPNADVNAIDREMNVFERDVNASLQTAEMPVTETAEPLNADVNAITSDANVFEHEANAPIQTADAPLQPDVSRETAPNADVNAIDREVNTFEREVNGEVIPRVHREFSPEKQLTEVQNESIKALEMLSRAVNADIYLYDSSDDEKYRFSSGRYDPASDRIYIDINAGAQYEGTILRTAGHELVHYAKRWSPESFKELSSFVEQTLTDSGADITALMNEKRAQAFRFGNTLSEETAYEEVIADACQTMLTDTDALSRLAETKPTVFERVMDFLRDFVDNIRRVYSDYKPTTEAGRVIAEQTRETADRLSEIYSRALVEAGKARTEAQQMLSGQPSELDAAKTEQGSVLFDYRVIRDDMTEYRRMLTEWSGMTSDEVDNLMGVIGLATDIVEKNKKKLDYGYDSDPRAERPFNPVKKNSDDLYKISIDFSTLCRKRIVQAVVAENLERALATRVLTQAEHVEIRNALAEVQRKAKTIEVACALCYVEAARLKTPAQIQKFMDNRASVLYNHFAEQDRATKEAVNEAERAKKIELGYDPKAAVKGKDKSAVRDAKAAARKNYQLTDAQKAEIAYAESLPVTMFTTSKGLTELAENHYDIYKAYADTVRAASRSKGLESDVPWRAGDSDSITDGLIRRMNEGAGIRSQSWSDFQAIHLLDEIAMTIEMAARGAKMHSYSKVPDYVRLLGKTGHMINMSLIPTRDGNGFDAVEGMPYGVMLMLRDQYPDTAGSICIGVNDEQILRLLDSDEIDYVIPYHHSGNSIATRRALKIPEWTSYQGIQTEKGGDGPAFAEWFDLDRARETAARENANPTDPAAKEKYGVQYGSYKAMQEAADRYLDICAERGLTPKFKGKVSGRNVDFTTHPNYWKLLIDRKMVNQITGDVVEQKPVKPIFDPAVIYGNPADGNVGGILGRALEYYDAHQADVMYAVDKVTRSMAEKVGVESDVVEPILRESIEDIRNGDVLFEYRETDEAYLKAVEAGDTEKAQRMVDEAAKAAGYTIKAYHGTPIKDITVFDEKKIGSNTDEGIFGRGFYFSTNKSTSDGYAGVDGETMPVFLKVKNPWWGNGWKMQEVTEQLDIDGTTLTTRTLDKRNHVVAPLSRFAGVFTSRLKGNGFDSVIVQHGKHDYEIVIFDNKNIKSADPVTYDDDGNIIPLSKRFSPENEDIRYDYRISGNEATEPHASQRDIASSPEFEAFIKAYDAVHGEGAARTIVRTTEQFDRERARQRKREATAAQMARLPDTEAKLRRMAEAAERSRKDEAKINAIKNPAVRRAKLSAHLAKQEAEAIRRVAEIDAQMRVADQAYRDNVEMQSRLAEQQARAEERLRGVKAEYQERLDRERVRTAQAKFEGQQNASERVQRERYQQWWRNRIHEEDLRQARAEGRENVRQARAEERARAAEHAQQVRDYRAFRNRNADVINEQRQNRHNTYPTGEGAIGDMIDRKQTAYNERAAREQAAFEQEYLTGQESAASRTGAAYVPGAPDTEIKPYLSTTDTPATPPGNTFKPDVTKAGKIVEAVKDLPGKARQAGATAYRLFVNSAQPLDNIAKKQEQAGFLATASDYVTSARNAPAVASYIISEGLTDKSGNAIGKSLADVVLVGKREDVTFDGETVKAQKAFQDYVLHKHNVDRMSFTVRAKQELDALIKENPWIPDFVDETTSEFTRELYGLSEEQRETVTRWADLNRRFREAKDKPIFPAENGTVWTAEQSQARVEVYEREQPWMREQAEELYQWWDTFMREYAVGVSITAEEYEVMRTLYPHYVPTYREGKNIGKSTNAAAGSVSTGKAVHEATGGTSEVRWIQDTLAEQVMKIVGLQKQNALLLNLVDSAMLDPDGTMFPGLRVTPASMGYSTLMTAESLDNADHQTETLKRNADGSYTVTAWDNGKRVSAYVSEDVYDALFSMFGQRSKGYRLALNAGRKISTPMKSMITGYNPAFGIRNVVRDIATGLIQAEGDTFSGMGSYAANYVRAWNQILGRSDTWYQFKAQGGAGSTHYRAEDGLSSQAEKMMSPTFAGRIKDFLGWFNETSESAARYAAYLQYLRTNGDTPENRIRAIRSAAEITTDFSRSGDIGKLLNAWVPYSNAATQGVDRVLRDFTQGKTLNRLTRAAIVQGIPAAIIGLVVKGLGREDEYDEISDYHKDNYYLLPIPDGKWLRLPKTPFYGTLLTSGVSRAVEGVLGREYPFDGFGATAAEAFNLPGAGAKTLPEAVSSAVRDVVGIGPMLDLHMNKNFIGQDIVPSEFKDYSSGKFAPLDQQYTDETSAVAMLLSKMMLSAISPIQMDYLMKSYMGDFYHGIASIIDIGLLRSFTAEDLGKNLFDATLGETGSSFVVDPVYSNRYTGEYYDMLDAMAAQIAADKVHLPEGEHKNTLTYRTKQAIENKYGKDISAAYKTARSAVGEAEKRDAREEAVRLSIEALDFYEQAMAGKYGDDPAKAVEYEQYGSDVSQALSKLAQYEGAYKFEPNPSYAPPSLTVDKVKYELTPDQQNEYRAMYVDLYAGYIRRAILSQEYRIAGGSEQAKMLEGAADAAREETTARMREILSGK